MMKHLSPTNLRSQSHSIQGMVKRSFSRFSLCSCCSNTFMCRNAMSFTRAESPIVQPTSSTRRNLTSAKLTHIEHLLENNKNWVNEMKIADPNYFEKVSRPQKPKYLYFGCSDSRVPSNSILGLGPGELFVHRNVGNLIPGNDMNALSVLEYAVGHLGVSDIIVTGHYDCGAIRAATSKQDFGLMENWTRLIRDVYRLHRDYLDSIDDDEERITKLVELNVIEQCVNLFKTGIVQRSRLNTMKENKEVTPRIHGLVFNPKTGLLKPLKIDFRRRVGSLNYIYGLYADEKTLPIKKKKDDYEDEVVPE